MRRGAWLLLALSSACTWGCGADGQSLLYRDPTNLATPTEVDGIIAWITEPALLGALDDPTPEVEIAAYVSGDESAALEVRVTRLERDAAGNDRQVDLREATASGSGEEQRFRVQLGLVHGVNRFLAQIRTPDRSLVRRLGFSLTYDGEAPGLSVVLRLPSDAEADAPCDDADALPMPLTNAEVVCVSGSVTTSDGTAGSLRIENGANSDADRAKPDDDGTYAAPVELALDREQTLRVTAEDGDGRVTQLETVIVQDATPPDLTVTSRARETSEATLTLAGTATDAHGVDSVELQSDGRTALTASSPDAWELDVSLPPGTTQFELVARDAAGNETREPVRLSRLRILWLGPPLDQAGATDLELGRNELDELITVENQRDIEVVNVDVEPTVREALMRIREPQKFDVDTSAWGDAERNLQRILAMNADNADLSGTSLEELLEVANAIGLPSPRLLAQLLDLSVTEPFVDLDVLTGVVMDQLVGTHPNIVVDDDGARVIAVDLHDVLNDLTTLAPRFGPVGGHPGFLAGESYSPVLEPGFRITFPVRSNLVQYDGVDLSKATKDYHFLIEGDRVLDFNILTDDFDVVGLQDEPTVDLRFVLQEHPGPGRLQAGTSRTAQPDPDDDGFYRGNGEGWGIDPWLFERIAVETGYRDFHDRYASDDYQRTLRYDTGAITNAAVIRWNRGWVTVTTAGGVGSPPDPVYVWDFIMEVAQVRLHDGGIAEGEANMGFTLRGVPVGLSADELVEKVRPSLHEQEAELSEQLVGELGLANPQAELFYMPSDIGDGALAFVAEGDSDADYPFTRPGLFEDARLSRKVSRTVAVGGVDETDHEKAVAQVGKTYFAEDEQGDVFSVEIVARDGDRIGVQVTRLETVE